jgi:hypothetical protein
MVALELLMTMLTDAKVTFVPRAIRTPAVDRGIRTGEMGRVQGIVLGDGGDAALQLECNNGTVTIRFENEPAVEAVKALAGLPCVFPEKWRNKTMSLQRIAGEDSRSRDGADRRLLDRFPNK